MGGDKFSGVWSQTVGLIQVIGREGECVHQCFEKRGCALLIQMLLCVLLPHLFEFLLMLCLSSKLH